MTVRRERRITKVRSRPLRLAARLLGFLLVFWGVVIVVLYTYQTRLIFPGATTQGAPDARVVAPPGTEKVLLQTNVGDPVVAVFGAALSSAGTPLPDPSERPTLLYFYGNGYNLHNAVAHDLDRYRRLGLNVLIPEYLGYGASGGQPSEAGCYATADAAYEYLLTRKDVHPDRIILVGRSLGGAVAIDLASRRKVAGVAAFCTFTRMVEMARRRVPFLPSSLLLQHRFESLTKIGKLSCPILLGHGSADRFVPTEMTDRLAKAARTPVRVFKVDRADHNDFYDLGWPQVADEMRRFVETILGAP